MQMKANKRYAKPSELRRPGNASEIVDTTTVIPNGRNWQSSETIDRRCVNVTRNAKAASEDGSWPSYAAQLQVIILHLGSD
jgi:hypothetical protein